MTSDDFKRTSIENDKPVSDEVKTKNILSGGYSNENPAQGGILIEQAFSPK